MEDNYSKLYRAMVNSGYDAADLGGNEEEFRSAMQDSTMRKNFYDWASKNEKNGFRIGSYESYEARLAPAAKPSPAPLTPAAEEPRKEKAYTQVPALKAALEYDPMKNIEDKVKEAKEKKQSAADTEEAWRGVAAKMSLDAGRVPFRTVDSAAVSERLEQSGDAAREVVFGFREQPFSYKTTAEKIAKERMQNVKIQDDARDYVAETMGIKKDDITDIGEYTQEGGAYYADFSRAEEKRMNKELNDALTKQGDALYQQVGASLQEKMNKINPYKEITKNFLLGIGTTQWGAPQAPDSYMIGIDDEQTAVTYAAARALSLAKGMQEAAHDDGMWGNFLEGALSGLAEAGENMTDAKKMNDAIATVVKKWEEGGETTKLLNDDEKMLLDALAYQTAVASMYQDKISSSYNVGRTVGAMLPFAVEFLVNPASGLGRKTASQFGKYALKRFAKNTANKYVRSAIYNTGRGLGRIGGSVAGGAAMTATTGLPKTVLGVQERMLGRPDVDYADGKPVYTGQIDSEEFLPAVKKEVAKQMLEYGSEMLGAGYLDDMFTAARKLTKGTKGLGWIDRIVSGPRAKAVKSFMERTGWNGPLEEFLEEVHVGYLEPYLVGDTTHDKFFTPDNLIEVALGVAVPGTVMSTAKTIAGAADGSFKAGAAERWKMDRADRAAVAQWGAKWESWRDLRNTLMVSQPEEIEAKLKEIAGDNSLTGEQKMAAIDFGIYSLQYRTARGVADAMTPARKKNIDSMLHDIIFDARSRGYEAVESEKDAGNEGAAPDVVDGNTIALAEQALKDAETEVRRVLALSPDADVEAAINGRTAEEVALGDEIVAETINAYTTAKAKLEGMQDTLNKARESDRQIDETANDGVVYATTLSKTGEKIFITSGKVVLNNEGFIDVNQSEKLVALMPDSSKKFVKPGELREKIEVSNAEELKAAKRAEIVESGKVKGEIGNLEGEPTVAAGESVSQSGELVPGAEVEVAFDGNVFKLKVEGRDERGDIILSGEGASMAMPESLVLDGMKEAEALRNGKVVEPADEAAAPVVEAPKTALEQIPRNEKNVPLYEQVDSELAWDGVVEEAGGNEETAMIAVNSMIADKQDALKKAEKAKAKAGVTITEKIAAENERVANIERAKADLAKWEEIAGVKAKRALAAEAESKRVADEAAAKQRAEEERLRAEREAAERAEREALNGVPDMVDDKPQDARARGYRRVNGHKVDRQEPVRGLMGKEVAVKFSDSSIPTGRVAVIEAEQLQPSHIQGQRNPLHFIDEAQPKERNDAASVLSARKIAENVRPEEITSSVTAYTGAPTVNARGEAVQGNNRSAALRLMWENNPEQAAKYKQYLMDHAAEFGLNAEEIAAMKSPVLVNMLDVSDADAITLGQYVAQDTESGGTERIKPKNVMQKMGGDMRSFANKLLASNNEEASFAELVDANGVEVLKWMAQKGYITPTQYKSAFDSKGNLTAEVKNDLRDVMYQSIFKGGSTLLEEMFNALPAKAQKAILATAFRDYDSPSAERMNGEVQNSIRAYYALARDAAFANAKNYKEAKEAAMMWARQYQLDDVSGESFLPSENFSNFAIELAIVYKGWTQRNLQNHFNNIYDLVQGTKEASLFEEADNTPRTLKEAIKETFNIDYNGQSNSNSLAIDSKDGQARKRGGNGDIATGERIEGGERPADSTGGTRGNGEVSSPEIPNNQTRDNVSPVEGVAEGEVKTESGEVKTENAPSEADAPGQSGAAEIKEPTFTEEVLENGDKRITKYNSRGEVEAVSTERDGKIISVDSYDDGVLFETTTYDGNGVSTSVTRYDKSGNVVAKQEFKPTAKAASGVAATLIKGAKWENTGEPDKIKSSRKKGDSHDITWYIGKKKYGSTTAERDLLVILAEDYGGDLNAVWNAYEQGEVLLSANEAAILKKLIETNTSAAELQQGVLELDRENPAFGRATENVRKKLEATGVKVVQATKKMVDALMKGSAEGLTADELHELRGIVARGLADAEVKIVNCGKNPFNTKQKTVALKKEVLNYAEKNGIIGTMSNEETNGKGEVRISKKSIGKFVDDSASDKSVDKDVHLSVLPQIRDVIASSIEAEVHPDYIKIGDDRSRENGYNKNVLIHRCYGAVNVDGKVYRVKITLKEDIANRDTKAYSYEVTNIELLEGTDENAVTVLSQQDSSITGAKLLDKVEKSYDKGTKLLSASKNVPDFMKTFHGSGEKFDKFDHSFMGTGEGVQAFGWGTYVTEVEGIGRAYATTMRDKLISEKHKENAIINKLAKQTLESSNGNKEEALDYLRGLLNESWSDKKRVKAQIKIIETGKFLPETKQKANLYTVEIPDDNGSNYLHWDKRIPMNVVNSIKKRLFDVLAEGDYKGAEKELKRELDDVFKADNNDGNLIYGNISAYLGGDKAASQFLNDMGFVGISYPAEAMTGGRKDGARNYVIFNENDAQIESRIEFLRTPDGVTYGWAVNGTIYLTPEGLNPNTPIHEYTHLWAAALQKSNPKLWGEVVEAMKLSPAWNEVMADENYTDIHGDDNRVASEVLSRLSGNEGYRRYMEQAEAEIAAERNIGEKVRKKGALNFFKRIWNKFRNWLQSVFKSGKVKAGDGTEAKAEPWDVFVNKTLKDFDEGVNPDAKDSPLDWMFIGKKGAENLDKAEEATTRLDNLNVAREMETAGKDAKAIKLATGWERGADGKWRYETMDDFEFDRRGNVAYGKRNPKIIEKFKKWLELWRRRNALAFEGKSLPESETAELNGLSAEFQGTKLHNSHKLKDYIDAPDLFNAYPELADIKVRFAELPKIIGGDYNAEEKEIRVNKDLSNQKMKSVLVHEIQHAIQGIEGFANGGNTEGAIEYLKLPRRLRTAYDVVAKMDDPTVEKLEEFTKRRDITIDERVAVQKLLFSIADGYVSWDDVVEATKNPEGVYKRLAGEVEARNAEERMGMSMEERRNSLAEETYKKDVPKEDQIFILDNLGVSGIVENSANFVSTYKTEDGKDINYTSERAEGYGIQGGRTGNSYDGTGNSILQRQTDTGVPGANSGLNADKGEFCVVERVFTENGAFNFTSGEKIESADDVAYIFSALEDAAKEHSFVVYVKDGKPTVVELGMGSFNATMIDIPTASLAYSRINPDHVYFVHNHPSGNLVCSGEDVAMLRMFEDMSDVPVTGVIINLKTGKYGTFDTERHSVIGEKRVPKNEERLTVHTLDKQIFAPDYDPMAQPLVRSSQDVAQFLNSQRMGDRPKVSFLILSRANRIIGNIHTPFTDITTDTEAVARYINERVIQFGGENAILYGDFAISHDEAGGFRLLQNAMERFGKTKLLDVVRVEGNFTKSANDYGFLYEPEMEYNVAKENEERYNSPEQDIPVGEVESKPLTFAEKITNSVLEASAKNKENLALRSDALRMFGRDVANVLKLMGKQREYDKSTVDQLVKLAKMYFKDAQLLGGLTPYQVGRVMTRLNNAVGKRDITDDANELVNILVDAHNKELEKMLEKQAKTKAKKVNASGVEVIGKLDKEGQIVLEEYNNSKVLDLETIEDKIIDLQNEAAEASGKLEGENGEVERETAAKIRGLELARQYREEILAKQTEIKGLEQELKSAEQDAKDGAMDRAAYKEFRRATERAILESKLEMVDAYHGLIHGLGGDISSSAKRAKLFQQAQIDHVKEIQHNANSDLQGHPAEAQGETPDKWNSAVPRLFMSAMPTFQTMLKFFGEKAADGRGYLYERFIPQHTQASHNEYVGKTEAREKMRDKLTEIFGKKTTIENFMDMSRKDGAVLGYQEGGEKKTIDLTRGQVLYLYMINKMADGQMKLSRMGITDADVQKMAKELPEEFVRFADWVQEDFLTELRDKYNAVHERMFGAPMAAIESYFPIKINKRSRGEKVEPGMNVEDKPSTVTGSVIKRTKNAIAIDLSADAMQVLLGHIDDMENWAAWAEFRRDVKSLLNYRHFQNQVKGMESLRYGSGEKLWKNFVDVANIAAGSFKPSSTAADRAVRNIAKGVVSSKIAFRYFTAVKQILSTPAFWSEVDFGKMMNAYLHQKEAWDWAMKNLPGFSKRWEGRASGNEILLESDADWKVWQNRAVQWLSNEGMRANAFIDALTVATGAKAVFETKYEMFKKAGYSDERAKEKALNRAAEAYNESQQSSESAYLSPLQAEATFVSLVLTAYRNSPFGYNRKMATAIANLKKKLKKGFKQESIDFMIKQLMRDGLNEEQAKKFAKSTYRRSVARDAADVALYEFFLNYVWVLGPSLIYILGGDDDEKKKDLNVEALIDGVMGGLGNLPAGETLTGAIKAIAEGDVSNFKLPQAVAMQDMETIADLMQTDPVRAAGEVLNILVAMGVGVNPQTFTDMYVALSDVDDFSPRELTMLAMRLINAPNSKLELLEADEAMENYGEKMEEITREYAEYQKSKRAPLTGWMYGDESEQKAMERYEKRFKKILDERLEAVVENTAEYEDFYNNADPLMRAKLSKLRKAYLEGNKKVTFEKLEAEELVKKTLYGAGYDDINTVYYELSNAQDEDMALMINEKLKELKPLDDEYKRIEKKDGYESAYKFYQENQKAFDLYDELAEIEKGVSNIKKLMKDEPEDPVKDMADIRELRTKAIDLINNYNE